MIIVRTSTKGQIVLPKKFRKKLDIKPGQKVTLRLVGNHVEIRPLPQDPIEYLCGLFKGHPESLAQKLLAERKKDQEREEVKITRIARGTGLSQIRKGLRKR